MIPKWMSYNGMENPPAPSSSIGYCKFNFDKIFEDLAKGRNLSKHKINVCIYFVYLYRLRLRWDKLIKPLHHKFNKEVKKIIQLYSKEFCVWYLSCYYIPEFLCFAELNHCLHAWRIYNVFTVDTEVLGRQGNRLNKSSLIETANLSMITMMVKTFQWQDPKMMILGKPPPLQKKF